MWVRPEEKARVLLQATPVTKGRASHNIRLVLCLLQALEELQALGRGRLCRFRVRIRFSLHANGPLSASPAIMSKCVAVSVCIVGGGRDVAVAWRGRREGEGLLVEPSRRAPSRSHPASRPTPLHRSHQL